LRLVFFGTPEFAVPTLEKLVEAGHDVCAVFTQPDRPKGRGRQTVLSPVKETALRLGLAVYQPERVRRPEVVEELAKFNTDAMVIVGYGQIIPQTILDLPRHGVINVHGSLLPKYRGAAPIQWAIANGETRTGVTTMRIDAGLDTGDILLKAETGIGPEENAVQLAQRLSVMGAALLLETLEKIEAGAIVPQRQNSAEATLAPILKKEDGRVDWNSSASRIYNRSRGLIPWPGAYTTFRGQLLHLWNVKPAIHIETGIPGSLRVQNRRLLVLCGGNSALELLEVQLEGRKRIPAEAFRNGQHLTDSEILGEIKN
jgi:methionyl-tRNA formyltransferase